MRLTVTANTLPGDATAPGAQPIPDHIHGSSPWWHSHHKCLHPECVAVYREKAAASARSRRARRQAERVLNPDTGRREHPALAEADSQEWPRHGTRNGYIEYYCRCLPCSRAVSRRGVVLRGVMFPAALLAPGVAVFAPGFEALRDRFPAVDNTAELAAALIAVPVGMWLRAGRHAAARHCGRQRRVDGPTGGWGQRTPRAITLKEILCPDR